MGSAIEDVLVGIGSAVLGKEKLNEILINRLVNKGRTRPHPWSTRCGHICWSSLTDRTYNARLLAPKPYTGPGGAGTPRPPLDEAAALFAADPAGQRVCPKSTCLFPSFAQYLTDGFIRTQMANDPPYGDGIEDRADSITRGTRLFGELPELDSLGVVELAAALEDRFDIVIEDEDFTGEVFESVGTLTDFIDARRTGG